MKTEYFFPLMLEESVHVLIWIVLIKADPDLFPGNLGLVVIFSLAIAILLSNLFDIVSYYCITKRHTDDAAVHRIPQPVRYFVITVFFTASFLFISQYAQARTILLIWLGCAYALVYVVATHGILVLLDLEESILANNGFFFPDDEEDDDEDDFW